MAAIPQEGAFYDPDQYPSLRTLAVASGQSIAIDADTGEITGDVTYTSW